MSEVPFQKRQYDAFISYSHRDAGVVATVTSWLETIAGLKVWRDANRLAAGDRLTAKLPDGVKQARASICFISKTWINSSWCEDEFGVMLQERRDNPNYRLVGIRLDDEQVPSFIKNLVFIPFNDLNVNVASQLLRALVVAPAQWFHSKRDLYLSCGWHPGEVEANRLIVEVFSRSEQYRMVGDSPEYGSFDETNRIPRIIETCGALVAVLPFRNSPKNGNTSSFCIKEVQCAARLGIPYREPLKIRFFAPQGPHA